MKKILKKIEYKTDPAVMQFLVNVTATLRDAKTGKVKKVVKDHNVVVNVGKEIIAEFLAKTTPTISVLSPNFCAVGTDATLAVAADETLVAEIDRTVIASKTNSGNVAYFTGFFGSTDGNGVIREVGLFINATTVPNSGIMFNRVNINITKSASETLTIDFVVTVT